jgi:hypothetical protein
MNSSSSTAFSRSGTFFSSLTMTLSTAMEPLRVNWKATEPAVPRLPPECVKVGADISGGAVQVVGQAVDVDGDACGAVAFVGDLLVDDSLGAGAEGLVDGSLNLGVGHGDHAGTGDGCGRGWRCCPGWGRRRRAATVMLRECLEKSARALGVDGGLLVLGGSPLRVSGHAHLLLDWQNIQIIQKQG